MSLRINLLGRPQILRAAEEVYPFRSRKSWGVLAYLVLNGGRATRSQLASLLFSEADDPVRALRWSLSEIRRGLGPDAAIVGDPIQLRLPSGTVLDVDVVTRGSWTDAVELPGLGSDLLDGMQIRGAPAFETWLLSQQRHIAAASETILHEAALGAMSRGEIDRAIGYAVRATAMTPLDENHQALLIRLYRLAGNDEAAAAQLSLCTALFESELGVSPGPAVMSAIHENRVAPRDTADESVIEAMIESGAAAISAGAVDAGVTSLRSAVRLADGSDTLLLRIRSRLVLGEALIHSLGGLDEDGLGSLHEAATIALAHDQPLSAARARAELGYVDYLRARYARAELWLTDALDLAEGSPSVLARATMYLGAAASDQSHYLRALELLERAATLAHADGHPRTEAFARSMAGRVHLLRGDLAPAESELDASIALAERDHWLGFLPWPQALLGDVLLEQGDVAGAAELLRQAFARACQLGNPCWEGTAARGLARVAEAEGDTTRAFAILDDAARRSTRLADPYVWLAAYILDTRCDLGRRHGHPDTSTWVARMQELTSRTGMRELAVRSLVHGAAIGRDGDGLAATMLAADIDNPQLQDLLAGLEASSYARAVDLRVGRGPAPSLLEQRR
ncbi:MAG TPA: BTAD domain-containing putative transcriptional regulator [Candidatus Nanopelagicales bacterium]|nr:BTAD domain-containing putative transcriptional regulator [Candidatus Nanopelagicales bacterium]